MDLSYDRYDDDDNDDDDDDANYANKLSINATHITGVPQFCHSYLFLR